MGSQSRDFEKYERYQIRVFRDAWRVIPIFEAFKTENSKAFSEHTKNLFPLPSQKVGVFVPRLFHLEGFLSRPHGTMVEGLKTPWARTHHGTGDLPFQNHGNVHGDL